jgi:hypothetical protein
MRDSSAYAPGRLGGRASHDSESPRTVNAGRSVPDRESAMQAPDSRPRIFVCSSNATWESSPQVVDPSGCRCFPGVRPLTGTLRGRRFALIRIGGRCFQLALEFSVLETLLMAPLLFGGFSRISSGHRGRSNSWSWPNRVHCPSNGGAIQREAFSQYHIERRRRGQTRVVPRYSAPKGIETRLPFPKKLCSD